MGLTIYNLTPPSPTTGTSEAYVAYADLGPRPECSTCDSIDECPECPSDQAYKIPVVVGDLIYLQFRRDDNFNADPQVPEFGWRNGADEYWISATLAWSGGQELELNQQNIIAGKEVGWFDGSYQNLILNSTRIQDYMNANLIEDLCFRFEISVYRYEYEPFLSVISIIEGEPEPPCPTCKIWAAGTLIANTDGDIFEWDGEEWGPYSTSIGIIYNQKTGRYYEYDSEEERWIVYEIQRERVVSGTCLTSWYQFVVCEQTVIVEGQHGESDCRGNYYGGTVNFRDRYRVLASLELVGFTEEKTLNENDIVTHSKQSENWLFRIMRGIPEQVARRLANSIMGEKTFLDNNEFINFSDVNKNNETGLHWWSAITAQRELCEKDKGCSDEIFANPLIICETPDCPQVGDPVNVHNSDNSFDEDVVCGDSLLLEDYNYEVNLNGQSVATGSYPAMVDVTLNITITS